MDNLPELPVYAFTPTAGGMLSLIITLLLPLAVAVITTRVTSPKVKGVLLLVLVAVKTTAEAVIANNNDYINFAWVPFLMNLALNFLLAVGMHFGLWKPTNLAAKVQEKVGVTTGTIDGTVLKP